MTTETILHEPAMVNHVVYIVGDAISYGEFDELTEDLTGRKSTYKELTSAKMISGVEQSPGSMQSVSDLFYQKK